MLRFTVRFDRMTSDNEDDLAAEDNFYHIPSLDRRLLEQFKCELACNDKLKGLWDVYFYRNVRDNLFCVWVGFDWHGSGPDFFSALQSTYDEHGMSGFYDVLDVVGESTRATHTASLLKQWNAEADAQAHQRSADSSDKEPDSVS